MGVDCRFFAMGVMDELYGITEPLPPRLPQDTATNNRPLAVEAIRQISDRYPCRVLGNDESAEPGDVLVVRRPNTHADSMHHLMIQGPGNPAPIWHAFKYGVCFTTLIGWERRMIFRPLKKENWAR
jgi:hypothetical protein